MLNVGGVKRVNVNVVYLYSKTLKKKYWYEKIFSIIWICGTVGLLYFK